MNISTGTMGVTIVAILAGLVGAYALRAALIKEEPPEPVPPTTTAVPLASTDLPVGRRISLGDISLLSMTSKDVAERKLPRSLMMIDPDQIIGRILREPVGQGQPFLTTSFYLEGTGPSITERLKPGLRAVTLTLSEPPGEEIEPEVMADVIFRATPRRGSEDTLAIPETTITLLEGVEVLAVDESESVNRRITPARVTLAVTLQQATVLQTVEGRGELTIVVRGPGESVVSSGPRPEKLTLEDLLGIEPPPKPVPPFRTEIYRRGNRRVLEFPQDGIAQQVSTTPVGFPVNASPANAGGPGLPNP